jgi:glycosyltransferase involved in cell wall biosynthesis
MRYLWDHYPEYFGPGRTGRLTQLAARFFSTFLRTWDESSANRVDVWVANSDNVAARVEKRYRRQAEVVPPPVDVSRFRPRPLSAIEDYYLMVSAFAPYKKVDLAIEAFKQMGRPLRVVGWGQEWKRLKALAAPPVELLGPLGDPQVAEQYGCCRALVFPGEEDAGITPLEAQAAGRPVIALARGGALETVIGLGERGRAPTGVFFDEPTVPALIDAVARFEESFSCFDPSLARRNSERFDCSQFKARMSELIERALRARDPRRRFPAKAAGAVP